MATDRRPGNDRPAGPSEPAGTAAPGADLPIGGVLPIDSALPALRDALAGGTRAVLQAPPGAGKTTRVPLALLAEPWLAGHRIIMLEPRRLAARAAAGYMARRCGEAVGETVGYRVRLDTRIGPRTRIEVVTEGVLTRMLQDDPALDDVGLVIFDEFHERSLHADLGLALTLQSQSLLRADLRILVMSATLDVDAVVSLLDGAPVIRSEGRAYDVDTIYLDRRIDAFIEPAVTTVVRRALREHDGDILVFLPGAAEIRRTAMLLTGPSAHRAAAALSPSTNAPLPAGTRVMPLFGDLPQDEQDRAIAPSPPGSRKVVLATAIAETSLTIEGVRVVVDSGLMRVPRFSPRTGMTRLATVPVSRAAADQRRGRAGRLGPGTCYRLWTEGDQAGLIEHRPAEILEADLAPLALELAAWGVHDAGELRWIDAPPAASLAQARELLRELDALDAAGVITQHGRQLASLALHPRLAHMLQRATALGLASLACDLAALLSERDVIRAHDGSADPDLRLRLPLLRGRLAGLAGTAHQVDRHALRRAQAEARHWRRRLRVDDGSSAASGATSAGDEHAGLLLAFAYPDRIAQQRGGRGRFILRNGRGAAMDAQHPLAGADMIVAAEVGGHGRDSRIFLAAPTARADVEAHFDTQIETMQSVSWDDVAGVVRARETRRLGALVLADRPLRDVSADALGAAVIAGVRESGLRALNWSRAAELMRRRLAFLHRLSPADWPDVSDTALLATLEDWLVPFLAIGAGATAAHAARALRAVDTLEALLALVGWDRRALIDRLAPTHIEVPSGSRIAIDYEDPDAPVLAVRLQELFGLADTPRIADGRVPLTLHLLSPARRPVQVTRDLASFWRDAYFEVRKDLRGRYPKHYWPEDPMQAEPTRHARRRGRP
jgi:ATP-dependent helicase HrpB